MTDPDRLTDEARAEKMIRVGGRIQSKDARALVSALAYIAHLELVAAQLEAFEAEKDEWQARAERLEGALREIEAVAAREDKVLPIVHTALKPAPTEQEEA